MLPLLHHLVIILCKDSSILSAAGGQWRQRECAGQRWPHTTARGHSMSHDDSVENTDWEWLRSVYGEINITATMSC